MKVIAISGSPRKNGNSERMMNKILQGAKDKGHDTQFFRVEDMNIHGCRGCNACFQLGHCAHTDDMQKIYSALQEADHVILGTPVYMEQMTSQLKTITDRFLAFMNMDFTPRLTKHPKLTLVVSQGQADDTYLEYFRKTIKTYSIFGFEPAEILVSGGNRMPDDVEGKKEIMDKAYAIGSRC